MTISEHIYQTLSGKVGELGGRVYPIVANEGTKMPYVVYSRKSTSVDYSKDGSIGDSAVFAFTVVSDTYLKADSLAQKVRRVLEDSFEDYNDLIIDDVRVLDISDDYIDDQQVYTINLSVQFNTFE